MGETYDTGRDLLAAASEALAAVAAACDDEADGAALAALAERIRAYLGATRATTTLGMPLITGSGTRLSEEMVIRRSQGGSGSHVRIVP